MVCLFVYSFIYFVCFVLGVLFFNITIVHSTIAVLNFFFQIKEIFIY